MLAPCEQVDELSREIRVVLGAHSCNCGGVSVAELSRMSGVPVDTIKTLERGRTFMLPRDHLMRLWEALDKVHPTLGIVI